MLVEHVSLCFEHAYQFHASFIEVIECLQHFFVENIFMLDIAVGTDHKTPQIMIMACITWVLMVI